MKKAYESRLQEAVNTGYELAKMTGQLRKQRWMGLLWLPVLTFFFYFIVPDDEPWVKVILAAMLSFFPTAFFILAIGPITKNNIRKMLIKAQGTKESIPAEYELSEDALVFRKQGHELRMAWDTVVRFEDMPTMLVVHTEPLGLARIPKRIFADNTEMNEWATFIKTKIGRQSLTV